MRTDAGRIETEHVVNAAGSGRRRCRRWSGRSRRRFPSIISTSRSTPSPGTSFRASTPCFRDTDNLVYGKAESGGIMFGGYEPDPVARWADGVPWEHGGRRRCSRSRAVRAADGGGIRRFPFLETPEWWRWSAIPDAMTPDGNPLLGPVPGVPGFWLAAGLSLNGFGGAGGIGKAIAE